VFAVAAATAPISKLIAPIARGWTIEDCQV
jgi:hypothetical protein